MQPGDTYLQFGVPVTSRYKAALESHRSKSSFRPVLAISVWVAFPQFSIGVLQLDSVRKSTCQAHPQVVSSHDRI